MEARTPGFHVARGLRNVRLAWCAGSAGSPTGVRRRGGPTESAARADGLRRSPFRSAMSRSNAVNVIPAPMSTKDRSGMLASTASTRHSMPSAAICRAISFRMAAPRRRPGRLADRSTAVEVRVKRRVGAGFGTGRPSSASNWTRAATNQTARPRRRRRRACGVPPTHHTTRHPSCDGQLADFEYATTLPPAEEASIIRERIHNAWQPAVPCSTPSTEPQSSSRYRATPGTPIILGTAAAQRFQSGDCR